MTKKEAILSLVSTNPPTDKMAAGAHVRGENGCPIASTHERVSYNLCLVPIVIEVCKTLTQGHSSCSVDMVVPYIQNNRYSCTFLPRNVSLFQSEALVLTLSNAHAMIPCPRMTLETSRIPATISVSFGGSSIPEGHI